MVVYAAVLKHVFPVITLPCSFYCFYQYFNHGAQFNIRKGYDDLHMKESELTCRTEAAQEISYNACLLLPSKPSFLTYMELCVYTA